MASQTKRERTRQIALQLLWSFIGRPYAWAGDDPMAGFDCSGLINEILQSVGILPHRSDLTAQGLYLKFLPRAKKRPYAGCLLFWGAGGEAFHVEMALDDTFTAGASGGGSATTNLDQAIKANAFVKIRPNTYRGPIQAIADPFEEIKNDE